MKWPSERRPEVIGGDVLAELEGPFVLWVTDGTRSLVRQVVDRPVRCVRPGIDEPRRSGPPVAMLVDDLDRAEEHLGALFGVPAVAVAVRGSGAERRQVRFGSVLRPGQGESAEAFAARVRADAARVAAEETLGWWAVVKGAEVDEPAAGGWRRHWSRTAPRSASRGTRAIWG